MYDAVLVPTDASEGVGRAVTHALDLAGRYGATVHALHVVESPSLTAEFGSSAAGMEDITDAMRETGREAVGRIESRARERGIDAETSVVEGDPKRTILSYADEAGIDLIVMGTHGRTGIDRVLIGSVAEHVVRHADVPVLTVKMAE